MYWFEVEAVKRKKKYNIMIIIAILAITAVISVSVLAGIYIVNQEQFANNIKEEKLATKTAIDHGVYIKTKPIIPTVSENFKENVKNIYHAPEDGTKRVFLTFDDGPSKTVTPLILDLLKEKNIKATFFELGSRIELYPEITKRVYEEGHYLANHGYSHIYSQIYCNTMTVVEEYNRTEDAIRNAIQNPEYHSDLFRFPGGSTGGKYKDLKKEAIQILAENDVAHVDWNSLTGDSAGKHTKEEMLEHAISTIGQKKSVVILMHDAGDKILTYEILGDLINYLQEQGYEFKSFYDL